MKMLALDLGTLTGWACSADGVVTSGTVDLKGGRYEGGGMRYLRFRDWLTRMHELVHFDVVHYEEVRRHLGADAAHVYGGLLAHLTAWCEERKVAYLGIPVGTIKKHATGKGNAGKQQMIAAATARGWHPADDNEADALWILDHGLSGMAASAKPAGPRDEIGCLDGVR